MNGDYMTSHVARLSGTTQVTIDQVLQAAGIPVLIEKSFSQIGLSDQAYRKMSERVQEINELDESDHHTADELEQIGKNLAWHRSQRANKDELLAEKTGSATQLFTDLITLIAAQKQGLDLQGQITALSTKICEASDAAYQGKAIETADIAKVISAISKALDDLTKVHGR